MKNQLNITEKVWKIKPITYAAKVFIQKLYKAVDDLQSD